MKIQLPAGWMDDRKVIAKYWSLRWTLLTIFFGGVISAYSLLPADWLPEIPGHLKKFMGLGTVFTGGMSALSMFIKQKTIELGGKADSP